MNLEDYRWVRLYISQRTRFLLLKSIPFSALFCVCNKFLPISSFLMCFVLQLVKGTSLCRLLVPWEELEEKER